jgi:hypothetical protein
MHIPCGSQMRIDAYWISVSPVSAGVWAKPKRNLREPVCFQSVFSTCAQLVLRRFFNTIKQCRRIANRDDKLAIDSSLVNAACSYNVRL